MDQISPKCYAEEEDEEKPKEILTCVCEKLCKLGPGIYYFKHGIISKIYLCVVMSPVPYCILKYMAQSRNNTRYGYGK